MSVLRLRDATFVGRTLCAGPITVDLCGGKRAALNCASEKEATTVALLAAGIVKASSGTVLIGDYDPHVQSVHCKRIAALVPHQPFPLDRNEFARYVAYRAALWNVEPRRAAAHAALLQKRLAGMHEALAYPLIGALIGRPQLIVLDRPAPVYAAQILEVAAGLAVFSTHINAATAAAFGGSDVGNVSGRRA